ncbi:MAG: hypothetical protein EHM35_06910, partial [Planctomycetaceae bacterium]
MFMRRVLVAITSVLGATFPCGGLQAVEYADAAATTVSLPRPYVGAANVYPHDLVMQWPAVANAKSYSIHLGTDPDDLFLLSTAATLRLEVNRELAWGKCYYWRVDARTTRPTTIRGPLWRFTIAPPPPDDPDLLAWYAFDEAAGTVSVDLSGNRVSAVLEQMIWETTGAPGLEGGSVRSDGSGNVHFGITRPTPPLRQATLTGWFRIGRQEQWIPLWYLARGTDSYVSLVPQPANDGGLVIEVKGAGQSQPIRAQARDPLPVDHWTHLAVTMDAMGEQITVYEDGAAVLTARGLTGLTTVLETADFVSMGDSFTLYDRLRFSVDEVRFYARILDAEEIARTMRGHPDSPYEPNPPHRAQLHTSVPAVLRWKATDAALTYNVYAGTDINNLDLVAWDLTKPEYPLQQKPADGQTLCWQVEAVVDGGFVRGPLWQFSVTGLSLADVIKGAKPWWADYGKYYHQVAPDLSLTDMDGGGHRVRDYRGRHLLLAVWAPWCPTCREELVTLARLRDDMSEEDMILLAVTDESNRSTLPAFLAEHPEINFPVCITRLSAVPPFNSVTHVPSIFYVAPDGTMKLATVGA